MTQPIDLPVYLSPATLRVLSVQQVLADLARVGEQPGEVLRHLPDGRVEVRVGARTVDLELAEALDPGTRFLARLVRGRLVLHLLPPTGQFSVHEQVFEPGLREPALEVTVRSLVRALEELGLAQDPANISLARAVVLAGLPLSQELLRRLRRELGALSDAEVDALALVLRKRIPFDRSLIEKMAGILEVRGTLTEVLDSILSAGKRLPEGASFSEVRDILARLSEWTEGRSLPPSGEKVQEWVVNSGLFWESHLLTAGAEEGDLKELAARLGHALRSIPSDETTGVVSQLEEKASGLIDLIAKQQLADLAEPFGHDRVWSAEIPVRVDDENTSLHLLVREEMRETAESEESVEVQLRIRLTRLGQVVGSLWHFGDRLDVSIAVDTPAAQRELEKSLPALREILSNLDYAIVRVRSRAHES